jgi:hypothetical protein
LSAPPARTENSIAIPIGFHAFLIAVVRVHDPGSGDLVDLEIPGQARLRARASADVLRLGERIGDVWRATLHFATAQDGRLWEPIHLQRVLPIQPEMAGFEPVWSAAGKILRLDVDKGFIVMRVYPERARRAPFLVHAAATAEQLEVLEGAVFARLVGGLNESKLTVQAATPISLVVPERWKGWRPPRKHDQNLQSVQNGLLAETFPDEDE